MVVVSSHLALMECLVGPLRWNDANLLADFENAFRPPGIQLIPIDDAVLRLAAQFRASHKSLRTPDAIHAATGILTQATLFLTNDRGFQAVPGLPLALLDDILAAP